MSNAPGSGANTRGQLRTAANESDIVLPVVWFVMVAWMRAHSPCGVSWSGWWRLFFVQSVLMAWFLCRSVYRQACMQRSVVAPAAWLLLGVHNRCLAGLAGVSGGHRPWEGMCRGPQVLLHWASCMWLAARVTLHTWTLSIFARASVPAQRLLHHALRAAAVGCWAHLVTLVDVHSFIC